MAENLSTGRWVLATKEAGGCVGEIPRSERGAVRNVAQFFRGGIFAEGAKESAGRVARASARGGEVPLVALVAHPRYRGAQLEEFVVRLPGFGHAP